jgi:hypothetical protein
MKSANLCETARRKRQDVDDDRRATYSGSTPIVGIAVVIYALTIARCPDLLASLTICRSQIADLAVQGSARGICGKSQDAGTALNMDGIT